MVMIYNIITPQPCSSVASKRGGWFVTGTVTKPAGAETVSATAASAAVAPTRAQTLDSRGGQGVNSEQSHADKTRPDFHFLQAQQSDGALVCGSFCVRGSGMKLQRFERKRENN